MLGRIARRNKMASPYSNDLRARFLAAYESGDLDLAKLAATFQISPGWASLLCISNGTFETNPSRGAKLQNSTQLWFCTYNCQSSMNNAAIPDLALASSLLMASNQLRAQFRKCTSIVPKCQHPVRRTLNPSNSCHRVVFRIALQFVQISPGAPTS